MERRELDELLEHVAAGDMSVQDAAAKLQTQPFSDLGFAKVDHQRGIRQGVSEVIYGAGKTPDQIAAIVANMLDAGQERILITRIDADAAREVEQLLSQGLSLAPVDGETPGCEDALSGGVAAEAVLGIAAASGEAAAAGGAAGECAASAGAGAIAPDMAADFGEDAASREVACGSVALVEGAAVSTGEAAAALEKAVAAGEGADSVPELPVFTYYDLPRVATVGEAPEPDGKGSIVVACGGTSDIFCAEEAALTAEMLGNEVVRLYDVGVAGLHRLLAHVDELARARVVIAVAGMEGALASVIGGLVSCPVIAVPTSVGYGASLGGLSALLAMLNSCASGVSVVNIDNGFGAGFQASLINHL